MHLTPITLEGDLSQVKAGLLASSQRLDLSLQDGFYFLFYRFIIG